MSTITYNWAPFEIETEVETPTKSPIKISNRCSREEEFRAALDSYMADYRKHRAMIANKDTH
jgi:membrane-associated HD superfamily phosphohydrolase